MTTKTLKQLIENNNQAYFVSYQQNKLIYKTACGFSFTVPVVDLGDAKINAQEKASVFMKWIKKELDYLSTASNTEETV